MFSHPCKGVGKEMLCCSHTTCNNKKFRLSKQHTRVWK